MIKESLNQAFDKFSTFENNLIPFILSLYQKNILSLLSYKWKQFFQSIPFLTHVFYSWLVLASIIPAQAEVTLDHSNVVPKNIQGHSLSGQMQIPANYGKQVGSNLFHSFSTFNINKGESATFNAVGSSGSINNVIGRVTGGLSSHIDGLLRSTIPNANLYLLNPNGILFGKNARLDLQGSFHASTAAYLDFNNGGRFGALDLNNDVLVSAPPQAFGFLEIPVNEIGKIAVNGALLSVPHGKTLDLTAGHIQIKNSLLIIDSGKIRLLATQGKNTQSVNGQAQAKPYDFSANAKLAINNSVIGVEGNGSGRIEIIADQLAISNSGVLSSNIGSVDADSTKGISIHADVFLLNNAEITSSSGLTGNAGTIKIKANNLRIINNGQILSRANNSGDAGDIRISTETLNISKGGQIALAAISAADAGDIKINSEFINLSDGGSIKSATASIGKAGKIGIKSGAIDISGEGSEIASITEASGNAPIITIDSKSLAISNTGAIVSGTTSSGEAGRVAINTGSIDISSGGLITSSTSDSGNAGEIEINTGSFNISGVGAGIESFTQSVGNAGNIKINSQSLDLSHGGLIRSSTSSHGDAGGIAIKTGPFDISGEGSGIASITEASGNARNITIDSKSLAVSNKGAIASSTKSRGNSGNIHIKSGSTDIDLAAFITSSSFSEVIGGKSGDITIEGETLNLHRGSFVASSTLSSGDAGNISINISGPIVLSDNDTLIDSSTKGSGKGGSLAIKSSMLTLNDGAIISSSSLTQSPGGTIGITAPLIQLNNQSVIAAINNGTGEAGTINLKADDSLILRNQSGISVQTFQGDAGDIVLDIGHLFYSVDSLLSANAGESGKGGNISIFNPDFTILNNTNIIADAAKDDGGNIDIKTDFLIPSNSSLIQASSGFLWSREDGAFGRGYERVSTNTSIGGVVIKSFNSNIAGSLAVLPTVFLDKSKLLQEGCGFRYDENSSSLTAYTVQGRVQASPDNIMNYLPAALTDCSPKPRTD